MSISVSSYSHARPSLVSSPFHFKSRPRPGPGLMPIPHLSRRFFTILSSAVRQESATTLWTPTPISRIESAAESLFHVTLYISDSPDLVASHTRPGQYLQLKVPSSSKPSFLAIASPPKFAAAKGVFEFLVKTVPGSTAELLCELRKGDLVELTCAMGNGFDVDRISSPEEYPTVLIFATGSGIRY